MTEKCENEKFEGEKCEFRLGLFFLFLLQNILSELKSDSPKRPLPETPFYEELMKYPWFHNVSRKDAEIAVAKSKYHLVLLLILMQKKYPFFSIFKVKLMALS